ncbi:peptidase inhibitor family I36 protein [Streptomyces nogalater]|uniref:Peptidase inhibitor family I36 protein n=1 Tax=Streptomyces nogalater TaxID=38314 RepID=A0ABW0WLL8_STRNO
MKKIIYVGITAVTAALMSTPATAGELGTTPSPQEGTPISGALTPGEEAQLHEDVAADDAEGGVIADYNGRKINLAEGWQGAAVCGEDPVTGEAKCWDSVEESNQDLAKSKATHSALQRKNVFLASTAPAAATADPAEEDDEYTDDVTTGDGGSTIAEPDEKDPVGPGSGVISALYTACPAYNVCLWEHADFKGRMLKFPTQPTSKTRHLSKWGFRDKTSSAYVNRTQRGVECYDIRTGMPDPHLFLGAQNIYKNFKKYGYPLYAGGGNWNDKIDAIKY